MSHDTLIIHSMQVTRDYLLFGIDHKQFGAADKMNSAIIAVLDQISADGIFLKKMTNGDIRLDSGAMNEILAARARARFYSNLLAEAENHLANTSLFEALNRASNEALKCLGDIEKLAKPLIELYSSS